ncbi:MAG: M15 family metallopeptidase [Ferruginibacter sp.]|nr:M15 family metallopeptidase [Ferruginibacter sp.]
MSWKNLSYAEVLSTVAEDMAIITIKEAAGHLTARDIINANYGAPGDVYKKKFCEVWEVKKEFAWFPADKIYINKDFRKVLTVAFKKLHTRGQYIEIKKFDGCYNERLGRGLKLASLHSWALAIDLNAATNPLAGKVTWSTAFLDTMRECGIYCGADWKRKDGMHFAMFNG